MAAARCPAETPAWIKETKAHLPHLPVSEARKGRGEGWRVRSRLADTVAARPEEGGARRLKDRVVRERLARGRAGEAHVEKDVA